MKIIDKPDGRKKEYNWCSVVNEDKDEKMHVKRTLNPVGQRLYWLFKNLTENGKEKVAVKGCDIRRLVKCSHKSYLVNIKLLIYYKFLTTETISHKGNRVTLPRRCYIFMGVKNAGNI